MKTLQERVQEYVRVLSMVGLDDYRLKLLRDMYREFGMDEADVEIDRQLSLLNKEVVREQYRPE